jgi:hypothetical protein
MIAMMKPLYHSGQVIGFPFSSSSKSISKVESVMVFAVVFSSFRFAVKYVGFVPPTALVDEARERCGVRVFSGESRLCCSWSKLCEGATEMLLCELTVDGRGSSCDMVELRCFLRPRLSVTFCDSGVLLGISIFATASGGSSNG